MLFRLVVIVASTIPVRDVEWHEKKNVYTRKTRLKNDNMGIPSLSPKPYTLNPKPRLPGDMSSPAFVLSLHCVPRLQGYRNTYILV